MTALAKSTSCWALCISPRCEAKRLAGDVAARLMVLKHSDWAELVILRLMPAAVFFDGAAPGPRIERLGVGDPLRPYVCGHIGDLAARDVAGNLLRYSAESLAAVAKYLTTAVRS